MLKYQMDRSFKCEENKVSELEGPAHKTHVQAWTGRAIRPSKLNPPNNPAVISSFQQRKLGTEKLNNFPKITQLVSSRVGIQRLAVGF